MALGNLWKILELLMVCTAAWIALQAIKAVIGGAAAVMVALALAMIVAYSLIKR